MKFFSGLHPQVRHQTADHSAPPDYSGYSNAQLLDQFRGNVWHGLKEENHLAILQELEQRRAAQQGRPAASIAPERDPMLAGAYNGCSNTIWLQLGDHNSYDVLDSYIHESTHAMQEHCANNDIPRYDEHTDTMIRIESARTGSGSLYNYAQSSHGNHNYDIQCNELDSNNQAALTLLSLKDRYGSDPEYQQYMRDREKHFAEVNDALRNEKEGREELQTRQIQNAVAHGDLSKEQAEKLTASIHNDIYTDATSRQSLGVQSRIVEFNRSVEQSHSEAAEVRDRGSQLSQPGQEAAAQTANVGPISRDAPSASGVIRCVFLLLPELPVRLRDPW